MHEVHQQADCVGLSRLDEIRQLLAKQHDWRAGQPLSFCG